MIYIYTIQHTPLHILSDSVILSKLTSLKHNYDYKTTVISS